MKELLFFKKKNLFSTERFLLYRKREVSCSNKKENPPKREDFLKKALRDCQQSLEDAYCGLQNTNEPDLIDRYIYEWKAANLRYKVLLRDIKEAAPELSASCVQAASTAEELSSPARISSTNLDTDTSLLNRSFR